VTGDDRSFDPRAHPDRLNLGCGWDLREGYLNVDLHDFHNPDLVADVTDLAMLPDGHYREILAQDVLEHLPRTATLTTLVEWNRVLATGGRLVLRVPSLLDLAQLFAHPSHQAPKQQEWLMQCLCGTQAYSGDVHLTSFTRALLSHYLAESGFSVLSWEVRDDWLFEIEVEKTAAPSASPSLAGYEDLLRQAGDIPRFLGEAYRRVLDREPDPTGEAFFTGRLESGEMTVRQVLETLLASEEASARSGPA
jgi:predicted SAM-dependent methyltransferase